ncbi:hypothetical protein [Mesorhizobium xinjiangense]|uniref:hypothetical protein n=1 Tax=Mesorhizobium xinjiangense TaxID=2678685 RepID=UPI0012ED9BF3|nr:hypothetical protein [Mesorhizobium xinjiangense]
METAAVLNIWVDILMERNADPDTAMHAIAAIEPMAAAALKPSGRHQIAEALECNRKIQNRSISSRKL